MILKQDMSQVEITMFISQEEIEQEIARIRLQERLRGRTLTADEVVGHGQDFRPYPLTIIKD